VPIWIDDQARIATMVIDSAVTLTGSMNWTLGAAVNSEDLNLISSPAVAAAYAGHWRDRLAISVRFARPPWLASAFVMTMADGPLRRPSRSPRAQGLCKVTVLVPEDCADGVRQFAQELRDRQPNGRVPETPKWRAVSPSAELMVSQDCSARGIVRDTRAPGGDRFRWIVVVLGQLEPVAEGRTENRAEARSLAEAAVAAYFTNRAELSGTGGMCDD
jgi:hypothetical protein